MTEVSKDCMNMKKTSSYLDNVTVTWTEDETALDFVASTILNIVG